MTQIRIDFSDIEEFEPLPVGRYPIMVEVVALRQSQSSENPYLNWELKVTVEPYLNRRLFLMTSLSPKALWRLKAVFEAFGVFAEDMNLETTEVDDMEILITPAVAGKAAIASVSQEVYQGRVQNRVDDVFSAGNEAGSNPAVPAAATSAVQIQSSKTGKKVTLR